MDQLFSILLFAGFGLVFVVAGLVAGWFVRPTMPNAQKLETYECGEPTIGSSWVQFDLRFYIVALFYLVFDVEVALLYPWATIFRDFPWEALVLALPFLLLVILGYAYEWHAGSLEWVRRVTVNRLPTAAHCNDVWPRRSPPPSPLSPPSHLNPPPSIPS